MIFDCFIFNDELDLLELRLHFLANTVDRFVIVESERKLSGGTKPLYYKLNQERFSTFHDKIIHLVAPVNNLPAWEYEFYQRNYIKEGLSACTDEDIIFISDADEIVNIKGILAYPKLSLPCLIEIPMYYYFLNVKTNASFYVNLAGNWSFIKHIDLGFRFRDYGKLTSNRITAASLHTGWHFSYLYGYNIKKYQDKIQSFSHQEFNTSYYLNQKRIAKCVTLLIDLFERPFMKLFFDNKSIEPILPYAEKTALGGLIYKPSLKKYFLPGNILFILHTKYFKSIRYSLHKIFQRVKKRFEVQL